MIRSVFESAAVVHPEMHSPFSRAMYGLDVMLDSSFQPKLLEVWTNTICFLLSLFEMLLIIFQMTIYGFSCFRVKCLCCFYQSCNVHHPICLGDLLPWLHQSLQVRRRKCFWRWNYKRSRILQWRIWLPLLKRNYACHSIVTEPQLNFVNSKYRRIFSFSFFFVEVCIINLMSCFVLKLVFQIASIVFQNECFLISYNAPIDWLLVWL